MVHRAYLREPQRPRRSALVLGTTRSEQARKHADLEQVATLDEAKADFEASWKRWKAWAGMEEVP